MKLLKIKACTIYCNGRCLRVECEVYKTVVYRYIFNDKWAFPVVYDDKITAKNFDFTRTALELREIAIKNNLFK